MKHYKTCLVTLAGAMLLGACGTADLPGSSGNSSGRSSDVVADRSEKIDPPIAYYEALMAEELNAVFGRQEIEVNFDRNVYVNFTGGTVTKGFGISQSFLPCDSTTTIPATQFSEKDTESIMISVSAYFAKVDGNLKISLEPVGGSEYSTVYVGGSFSDLGCGLGELPYHAPNDIENANQHDIAFVFSQTTSNMDDTVTHIENAIETIFAIQNQASSNLVEPIIDESELNGLDEVHSLSRLLWELEDENVADISFLLAELNTLIPGGAKNINGFDRIVSVLVGVGGADAQQNQGTQNTNSSSGGGLLDWLTGALGGSTTNTGTSGNGAGAADLISAVGILTGHPEIAIAGQMLGQVIESNAHGTGGEGTQGEADQTNSGSQLPDLGELLGINGQTSYNKLIASMQGHAKFVNRDYDGKTKEALSSLLVVAYSQAFRRYFSAQHPVAEATEETNEVVE